MVREHVIPYTEHSVAYGWQCSITINGRFYFIQSRAITARLWGHLVNELELWEKLLLSSANTRSWPNIDLMLDQPRRQWPTLKQPGANVSSLLGLNDVP